MIKLALLGLLALTTGSIATQLGSTKCSWGPAYWCENIQQSGECLATKHCINKFWSNLDLPEDNDDVCTICKNMVKQARDTLRSNETISELKQVFETSCGYIPIKIVADECKVLSDQFIGELVETLSSEMNPQIVCATAGLCNSERIDNLLAEYYDSNPKTECDVCKSESNKIAYLISQLPGKQLEEKLLEICGYMSSYSDACKATVTENFDLIQNMLTKLGNGDLCTLIGICSETNANQLAQYKSSKSNDIQCEFCEKVIQHWVDTWTANTTEAEFKQVLEGLCHRMAKPERVSRCLHIVDDYYIPWFNFLLHEVNPHQICSLVGLCGANSFMEVNDLASITVLLDTDARQDTVSQMQALRPAAKMPGQVNDLPEIDVSQGLIGGYFVPKTAIIAEKPGCTICEYVVHELEQMIGDHRTEANIERAVKKLCRKLPSAVEGQCENLVSTYGPALVQLLMNDIESAQICSRLSLCTSDILLQQVSQPLPLQLSKRAEDSCALCEFAMTEVFSILNDTSDRQMVINVLDSICYKMPKSIRNECQKLVAEYTPVIANLIVDSFTPDQVCTEIQMCKVKKPSKGGDEKCVLCEYAITTLDKIISDKHNEDEVRRALDNLCSYLPRTIKKECTQFVDTYSQMVIELITKDLTPDQICQELGLCQPSDDHHQHPIRNERPYCTLCEYAIGEMDKLITDKHNEDEIKNVLDRICYELSAPIQKECLNMVTRYTDLIIQMFVSEYTPEQICVELELCKAKSVTKPKISNAIMSNAIVPIKKTKAAKKLGPFCVVCEYAMSFLEEKLVNNRTLDIVERTVQMVCSYLPGSVAEECEELVDEYGDKIVHFIIDNELDPKEVCAAMTLCASQTDNALNGPFVGNRRCVWGPALWCKSPFHARVCGTTEHCRAYVWNK